MTHGLVDRRKSTNLNSGRNGVGRVLFFTSVLGGGGAEKHLLRLANALHSEEMAVSVAVSRAGGNFEPELDRSIPYYPLGARRMAGAPLRLRKLVSALEPDLVFSVLDHANCMTLASLLGKRSAPPVVVGVQTPPSVAHARGDYRNAVILKLIRLLYPRAAGVVALSEGVRQDVLGLAPMQPERAYVIPNIGVDHTVRELIHVPIAQELPATGGAPLLIACGRLTEAKGFPVLLDAFAFVRQRQRAKLWILGEGELRGDLERQVARLGLGEDVWLPGFVTNPYAFMKLADVFVLSSLWEGFGNVIVEAMAAGTPVVSTDCPHGPRTIIEHEVNGLLVEPADPAALASAIVRVLQDRQLATRLAAAGQGRAEEFSADRVAEAYRSHFLNIIDRHRRA